MTSAWEAELATFLADLSAVQDETLEILTRKRELLASGDFAGLSSLGPREEVAIERLQQCLDRRQSMLDRSAQEGRPAKNLRELAASLPRAQRRQLNEPLRQSTGRARLLRSQSLANWLVVQRTLLHLSQMVEIIATGGRMKPTYAKDEPVHAGALVDHAV